jgi:hypothetical protein
MARRCFALLALLTACSEPQAQRQRPPPPTVVAQPATLQIDASEPEAPPNFWVSLGLVDPFRTPTTLSVDRVELFGAEGTEPLASVHGEIEPSKIVFAEGEREDVAFQNPVETNSELTGACNAERLVLYLRGSACECDIVVEGDVHGQCLPDARAADLLAAEGEPAPAGMPCAVRRFRDETGEEQMFEEHSYRYDAQGRLRFVDVRADGGWVERQVFDYESSGYLNQERAIDPGSARVVERSTFTYDDSGLLSRRDWDGSRRFIDGEIDWFAEYAFDGPSWQESVTEINVIDAVESATYVYDEDALTVSTDYDVVTLLEPLAGPNDFFALPHAVGVLGVVSWDGITFEHDDDGRLLSSHYPAYFDETRDEYVYGCE